MKLFAKNKNNKLVEQDAMSAVLNPETLNINAEPTSTPELEKIIKTTESLNIVSAINNSQNNSVVKQSKSELENVREAIYRSFDLARRKIATEYEQIIVSGNFVDNPFLAVQIVVKNYDKKWNVEYVESVVKKFTDAIPEHLSLGKTIYINDDLVIEPIMYVDKLLPSWKITPSFALLTNALKWEDVVETLIKDGALSQDSKEIIAELVEAISLNIKNGYYVKVSRLLLLQLYPGSAQKIVLFSNDTLQKMNEIYARFQKTGERKQINKYDTIAHFERTEKNIKNSFLTEEAQEEIDKVEFTPRDLTEEIPQELSFEEKQVAHAEKLQNEIETAKEASSVELEVLEDKPEVDSTMDTSNLIIQKVKTTKITNEDSLIISTEKPEEVLEVIKKDAKNAKAPKMKSIKAKPVAKKAAVKVESKPFVVKETKVTKTTSTTKPRVKKQEETQEFNLIKTALLEKKPAVKKTTTKSEVKTPAKKAAVKPVVKKEVTTTVVTTTVTTKPVTKK